MASSDAPPGGEPIPTDGFRFVERERGALGLWEGDRPVLVYNYGLQTKPGVPSDRSRSSYIHPLHGLDGEILTDDFPKDHYHHRGLFWAWPHIQIDGKEYDLWLLRGIRHQFERWTEKKTDASAAVLGVANGWYIGERLVVQEQVRLRVPRATEAERVLDMELRWQALDKAVTLRGAEGKSYGGLSLRFAPRQETVISTADGPQRKDLNVSRLAWADLTARFAGVDDPSGAAIFVDPNHPGFPPQWITRDYGFLGVGWPGTEPTVLQPGRAVLCKYRIWIHRGPAKVARLKQAYETYVSGR
jgi:hypothetical protein